MTSATAEKTFRHATAVSWNWFTVRIHAVLAGFRPHLALYAVAFASYGAALLQSRLLGDPLSLGLAGMISVSILVVAGGVVSFGLLFDLVKLWRSGHEGSPTIALLKRLFNDVLSPGRISNSFHAFIVAGMFAVGFSTIKSNIPRTNPFSWDEALTQWDRLLHFGHLPYEVLAPLFQHPLVTLVVNVLYNGWFLMLMGFFLWQGFRETDTPLRQRFLLAYFACWALGTGLVGTIFSSAGPCYYGRVVGGIDPYAPLMAYLQEANRLYPIWALKTQEMLWESYVTSQGEISGISAMPSMHVATSVLFFFCARAAGIRWLTWWSGGFAAVILLGSVLLGWHYAVDGYAAIPIAAAAWWLAGLWVSRTGLSSRPS